MFFLYLNLPTTPKKFFSRDCFRAGDFTSTENERVVEFKGDCSRYNAPAKMTVQFVLSGSEFELKYIGINDIAMDYFDSPEILKKVLSEYQP